MQPSPIAETSRLLFPSLRFCILESFLSTSGSNLALSDRGEFAEQRNRELTTNRGESVAVEEQERSEAMTALQEVERFFEGEGGVAFGFPFFFARFSSL